MTSTTALRDKQAMDYLFYPRSIAIIGASADPAKPGGAPLRSLISNGYAGALYPVNPNYDHLLGLPCFPSLLHIPAEVDLALIAVPAQATMAALRECAEKGVKAVVVLTSGFGETGDLGARMQAEMTALVRSAGISLCGPNCMGIFNARNKMTAGFVITQVEEKLAVPEFFGFISQSGGFSAVMHAAALDRSLGFTYFISSGNESDLQFADYLAYMVADPATKVIGGYLEGTRDGQRLMQAAEIALDAQKPVVVIKTGKSPVSAQAAASHTGALAGDNRVYQAFFKQKGIIRAGDFKDSDYNRAATRAEMAYIFSRALPETEFASQNTVNSLPDVNSGTSYSAAIFMLYRAGVLTGNDDSGTFSPNSNITRAQAAAIISRVILPSTRISGRTFVGYSQAA